MEARLEALARASAADRDLYRPVMFRPGLAEDRERLEELLKRTPGIRVHDELRSQVRELVRALNPSVKWAPGELDQAAIDHLGSTPAFAYGVWVYYPWSGRLVHLLDEAEFVRVRTDRNRNKITSEEQALLSTKKVGVIGLSVGQSVCMTLALERSFGELRIADFDTLDLSNLNRIRSGVHLLGERKAVNVAREIAELDPFLQVTPYFEGVNEGNIEDFLTNGGKLDLLVEECDSVAVKIIARQHAKAHRIPVVMDTSDRGLIDVERFDLEPDRPILHGLVDHLDLALAAKARTNEEKLPFVIPILGLEGMSTRIKASMLEIESTVTTWPQLASSVLMGGGLVAEVHRRIALGQFSASGRWYVDTEELLSGTERSPLAVASVPAGLGLNAMMSMAGTAGAAAPHEALDDATIAALVEAAALAPSAGNLQPWRFLALDRALWVFHDPAIGDSALDGGRLIPALDMGACLENIRLKAAHIGAAIDVRPYPIPGEDRLVAMIAGAGAANSPDSLATHLQARCTNRKKGDAAPMNADHCELLGLAARRIDGCDAKVIVDRERIDALGELVAEAERLRVLDPIGHNDLFRKELRWTKDDAPRPLDGLEMRTLELKMTEEVGFRVAADRQAMDLVASWDGGRGLMRLTRENFSSASGVVVITTKDTSPRGLLSGGSAMQRVWLQAHACGLSVHPCGAPLLLSHHVRNADGIGLSVAHRQIILDLHARTCALFGLTDAEPVFLMRLSHAPPPTARSLRHPVGTLLQTPRPQTV
jgi:nitroreductase/molybdopterin/thiamine biosynthesis adenylyltransferase